MNTYLDTCNEGEEVYRLFPLTVKASALKEMLHLVIRRDLILETDDNSINLYSFSEGLVFLLGHVDFFPGQHP